MAELVDALDSKSSFRKEVWVRFPLEVQKNPANLKIDRVLYLNCTVSIKNKLKL